MKMLRSVFKWPNYGLGQHYKNVEELKTLIAKRKGKTKAKRKEILEARRAKRADARLRALRAAHARLVKAANEAAANMAQTKV